MVLGGQAERRSVKSRDDDDDDAWADTDYYSFVDACDVAGSGELGERIVGAAWPAETEDYSRTAAWLG